MYATAKQLQLNCTRPMYNFHAYYFFALYIHSVCVLALCSMMIESNGYYIM